MPEDNQPNPDIPTDQPEQQVTLKQRVIRGVARLALNSIVLTGGLSGAGALIIHESDPIETADYVIDTFASRFFGVEYCPPAPSAEELTPYKQAGESLVLNTDLAAAMKEAESRGLHFADPRETLAKIQLEQSPEEAAKIVSTYTRENFGFSFDYELKDQAYDETIRARYHDSMQAFTYYTSLMPKELLRAADVDEVNVKNISKAGLYTGAFEKVDIHPDYLGTPGVFVHEVLGHALHSTSCDGMHITDSVIASMNPDGYSYGDPSYRYNTGSEFGTSLPSAGSVTASDYGATNVAEDVAELTQTFIVGDNGVHHIFPQNLPVSDKLAVVLDRMEHTASGSAEYFAAARFYFTSLEAGMPMSYTPPTDSAYSYPTASMK